MCGICTFVSFRQEGLETGFSSDVLPDLIARLERRGPNCTHKISVAFEEKLDFFFLASVLHLRGSTQCDHLQPVKDTQENIFLWNGEIFGGPLEEICELNSDTRILSDQFFQCEDEADVISTIASIVGPFAFIFYQKKGLLWFGRDIFGRRSLLYSVKDRTFRLSSVACSKDEWHEVPTTGIFCLDLNQTYIDKSFSILFYPWSNTPSGKHISPNAVVHLNGLTISKSSTTTVCSPISNTLLQSLPSVSVSEDLEKHMKFHGDLLTELLTMHDWNEVVSDFEHVLTEAVAKRVGYQLNVCKDCYGLTERQEECQHSSVGVLFSGGLDSIVLAALADRHLPQSKPIDLLNVAFAKDLEKKLSTNSSENVITFDTPDRLTGKNGVTALQRIFPHRAWNFVEINVTKTELVKLRQEIISYLLKPSDTVLDDSIGCALWFAARGQGYLLDGRQKYSSPARVLLVGMGADEQLGGYSRHRAKFSSFGWNGLVEEISLELDRIGLRNLGRDDRIIADNGRESRYPFLDESVVSFLNSLPIWKKMNLNYPRGLGEKLLLRLLAHKLGLTEAAMLPKRAIQFGSRIAKIENSKEKGSELCDRLKEL